MNTLIISPTYNEKKNITSLVDSIFNINKDYHVLIVDDNSPDGTAHLVKELQLKYKNLFLEVFELIIIFCDFRFISLFIF